MHSRGLRGQPPYRPPLGLRAPLGGRGGPGDVALSTWQGAVAGVTGVARYRHRLHRASLASLRASGGRLETIEDVPESSPRSQTGATQ